jgi:hypothetical protein
MPQQHHQQQQQQQARQASHHQHTATLRCLRTLAAVIQGLPTGDASAPGGSGGSSKRSAQGARTAPGGSAAPQRPAREDDATSMTLSETGSALGGGDAGACSGKRMPPCMPLPHHCTACVPQLVT